MGVAVVVLSCLGSLELQTAVTLLGIGLACAGAAMRAKQWLAGTGSTGICSEAGAQDHSNRLPDVVSDHLTGFVVEPRDIHGISKAIIEYFENDYIEKMHLAIQEEEKRFSWEHMVDVISEIL